MLAEPNASVYPLTGCRLLSSLALETVFVEWISLVVQYMRCERRPHRWSLENTDVGLFASAAWRSGGIALEQVSAKKKQGSKVSTGRIDLWLNFDGVDYITEAKVAWMQNSFLLSPKKAEQAIRRTMQLAENDVRASLEHNPGQGLALVFAPCWFRQSAAARAEQFRTNSIQGAENAGGDVIAWAFAKEALGHVIEATDGTPCLHSGTVLVGRAIGSSPS
jgi:hypothetical protein